MKKENRKETTIIRVPRERRDVSHQDIEKLRKTTERRITRGSVLAGSFDTTLGKSDDCGESEEEG